MMNKRKGLFGLLISVYLLIMALFVVRVDYQLILPGGITPVQSVIEIENDIEEDNLYTTYVWSITRPTIFQYLVGNLLNHSEISDFDTTREQMSNEELYNYSRLLKDTAIINSLIVAYEASDKEIDYEIEGVLVKYIYAEYDAFNKLKIGDVITSINDKDVDSLETFISLLNDVDCEEDMTVTILRDGKSITKVLKKVNNNDLCKLGIVADESIKINDAKPKYKLYETTGGGPSGGLMQALDIYNQLTNENITNGKKIAGTGTIDRNGNVGPIGGIDLKVIAADRAGVDIFIAPDVYGSSTDELTQYEIALRTRDSIDSDIIIIPAKTFDDVLIRLLQLKEN